MCGEPSRCGPVVQLSAAYVEQLETGTDFACEMLEETGTSAAAPVAPQTHGLLAGAAAQTRVAAAALRVPPWALALLALSCWVCCAAALAALCARRARAHKKARAAVAQVPPGPQATAGGAEEGPLLEAPASPVTGPASPAPAAPEVQPPRGPGFDLVTVTPQGFDVRPLPVAQVPMAWPGHAALGAPPVTGGAALPTQPLSMDYDLVTVTPQGLDVRPWQGPLPGAPFR